MDVWKDAYDAYRERLRSPVLGSIVFSFLAFNWKPVWFLIFAEVPIPEKFAFFDATTTSRSLYLWPILSGLIISLGLPWLKYAGAWCAAMPVRKLKTLQADEASDQRVADYGRKTEEEFARAKHEQIVANREIEWAKNLKEAEEIGGDDLIRKVKRGRETFEVPVSSSKADDVLQDLTPVERFVIPEIAKGEFVPDTEYCQRHITDFRAFIKRATGFSGPVTESMMGSEIFDALQSLKAKGVAGEPFLKVPGITDPLPGGYHLTALGAAVYSLMSSEPNA